MERVKTNRRLSALIGVVLLGMCLAVLSGCAAQEETTDVAAENRAYMSQANNIAMQLDEDLEPFTEAVADGDIVSMEQAASNVYRDIETFKALEAPDDMSEIHAEYSAGCDDLKEALQSYIALYQEADGMEADEINESLATIQEKYDDGISHLQAADTMVTQLNGALPSSSSAVSPVPSSSAGE